MYTVKQSKDMQVHRDFYEYSKENFKLFVF